MSTETGTENTNTFLLPDLGEGLTEAELVNWLVAVGDEIRVDQPIAEVETAKSMVEVPSPYAGTVAILHGEPGEMLDVGKPLITVRSVVEPVESESAESPVVELVETEPVESPVVEPVETKPAETDAGETYREEEKAGSGNVLIGYGTSGEAAAGRRTRARKTASPQAPTEDDLALLRTRIPGKLGAVISPLVRRMARENGVDLSDLQGSGESGLIMRRDVEAVIGGSAARVAAPAPPAASERPQSSAGSGSTDARTGLGIAARTPFSGVRKAVAANMSRSRTEIPEATVWVDVDATALLDLRHSLKKSTGEAPGLLAFIARFVTAGLKKYPELNTRVETTAEGAQEIVAFDGVNLGFAAQTDRGLMVPSIRSAEKMSARELDAEIRRLTAVVRDGKATPTELGSGTFTLNNYGVFGVDGSAAIINHPEVAILGLGRIIDRPWVVDGQLAVRKVTELTLAFDHRVCDGATAGGFLRFIADAMENPGSVLAEL
ncbi:dihydrolipoamide acetyltransferase family protein [Pseudarthrobacter sp. J75]|uniref:dihydrolipoamide acetyltransferase family protein n=1 Tax=unclassified Pseudarthrobacter TaxID=2647000 RepID=UPI002E815A9B|nr:MULTISPECIES: dihydrolipoamide acetyltransferase family protein [unclassified Pseudarthrobacter]MEE2523992.1 dihydrolipoamide acetyltransferase family protein [Pseudarthrobacter sp. J47]MEE2528240.1 dihydrolipoamide acetyltransferase family protein [Pseudarthrobacter sp. J75]